MSAKHDHDDLAAIEQPVGPFTGFSNFFRKEIRDWWNSLRLMIVTILMTMITLAIVFFLLSNVLEHEGFARNGEAPPSKAIIAARVMVVLLSTDGPGLILYIIIIIVTTMGLLTTEKSSGTLAWNLTKPLGRTGLFTAKWFAATLMLWLGTIVIPTLVGCLATVAYHGFFPDTGKIVPLVLAAFAWIGLWVLLSLTISLGFQSQGAVAGILFAFWIVPNVLGALVGLMLDDEKAMDWVLARLATNSPYWAWHLFADKALHFRDRMTETKDVWYFAYVIWFVALSAFSLRIFNRQEIGS